MAVEITPNTPNKVTVSTGDKTLTIVKSNENNLSRTIKETSVVNVVTNGPQGEKGGFKPSISEDTRVTGSLIVSSSNVDFTNTTGISGSFFTGSFIGIFKGALSSSVQIGAEITGAFTDVSSSISTRITNLKTDSGSFSTRLTTAESELGNTLLSGSAQIASDISGSLGVNATLIRSLTESSITGSFTSLSSSLETRIQPVEKGGGVGTGLAVQYSLSASNQDIGSSDETIVFDSTPEFSSSVSYTDVHDVNGTSSDFYIAFKENSFLTINMNSSIEANGADFRIQMKAEKSTDKGSSYVLVPGSLHNLSFSSDLPDFYSYGYSCAGYFPSESRLRIRAKKTGQFASMISGSNGTTNLLITRV